MKNKYWKVSVFDWRILRYVVKAACVPSERDARTIADVWAEKGYICHVTPHIKEDKE